MGVEEREPVAVALSADIPSGEAHPVILDGAELVAWRDRNAAIHLWEDRCPHRGMRLSFGFVQNNHLTCLYHGWEFGGDAGCKKIPAHPDLEPPKTLCVKRFAVNEAFGMVVLNGVPAENETTWHPVRSLYVDGTREQVLQDLPAISETAWEETPLVWVGTAQGHQIALAVHSVGATETAIHVSTTHPNVACRIGLAQQLVDYRNKFIVEAA